LHHPQLARFAGNRRNVGRTIRLRSGFLFELFLLIFLVFFSFQSAACITAEGLAAAPENDEMTMLISRAASRVR
jgi:hypothetical protein